MKILLVTMIAVALVTSAKADPTSMVTVNFSNPQLYPAQWTLTVHPDGSGHFHAEGGSRSGNQADTLFPARVDRDVHLSTSFTNRVFQTVHDTRILDGKCESHLKVAFQGLKKITYSGPDAQGGCEFNYSKYKEIQDLGESLVVISVPSKRGVLASAGSARIWLSWEICTLPSTLLSRTARVVGSACCAFNSELAAKTKASPIAAGQYQLLENAVSLRFLMEPPSFPHPAPQSINRVARSPLLLLLVRQPNVAKSRA